MPLALHNTELDIDFQIEEESTVNTGNAVAFIDAVKTSNILPISAGKMYYSDNTWDFSPYVTVNIAKHCVRITFGNLEQPFLDDVKNFALMKLLENKEKVQTIRGRVLELRKFFNYALNHHYYSVESISLDLIKEYVDSRRNDKNELGVFEVKKTIKSFYVTYSSNFKDILTLDMVKFFDARNVSLLNALRNKNKTPDIPKDYFNKYLESCLAIMRDNSIDSDCRAIACLHVIESQTGLRINEILGLRVDALQTITIFNGDEANYLAYRTWKRESGNNVSSIETTYINALSKEAFLALKDIHKVKRDSVGVDYLYMGSGTLEAKDFPLDYDKYMKDEDAFYVKLNEYIPTINLDPAEYPELTTRKPRRIPVINGVKQKNIETITHPSHHQFRVHCCTELYEKGVPLQYISRFMGHLSHEMEGYYVRPKRILQEDLEFSTAVFRDIVTGNAALLGPDKGLKARIDEYIASNNLSVAEDLDAICSLLAATIPVRQKLGGVCIKSSF